MRIFLLCIFLLSSGLLISVITLNYVGAIPVLPSWYLECVVFLAVTTVVLYLIVVRAPSDGFIQMYLLSMVLKLVAYGIFLFIVIAKEPANAPPNVAFFLTGYVLFTFLEVLFLFRKTER